jgi:glucosamine--fructose-6-phosphate aminotransferase (isomerizing)
LFIVCGSSYYVALAAASTMTALTNRRARAVPASEVLLYPEVVLRSASDCVPVLISRSGQTSEVLKVGELLKDRNIPTLAISCTPDQPLEKLATVTICLPADEKSTVMTRSFTSMLLALQNLAGRIAEHQGFCESLVRMPELAAAQVALLPDRLRDFVFRHNFADYVALGHGPFYGLACEYALKTMEMSVSYAQFFHSLEFRHGPKSIVGPETLLTCLISEAGYRAECALLEELKSLGGTTLVVVNRASDHVRASADLLVELNLDSPELARLAPSLIPGQLLGLFAGLKKGLDPDSPRNLSRAVILNDGSTRS